MWPKCMPSATESKLGHLGIRRKDVPQRLLEGFQPGLEVPPLVHALAENRPPHLLRAGGAHGARILMKLKHSLLERQPAVVEQPANFTLGVLDHVLVEHAVHPSGQDLVEV